MRSIVFAFSAAVLAAGAAYAHGSLTEAPTRHTAGILTCITKPEASLVFGRTPVAECTFVAERGGFRQTYGAMFSRVLHAQDTQTAQKIVWRVLTKDGFARPGMLSDFFMVSSGQPEAINTRAAPAMVGRSASLHLISHSGQRSAKFALSQPGIALSAVETSLTR